MKLKKKECSNKNIKGWDKKGEFKNDEETYNNNFNDYIFYDIKWMYSKRIIR
jgi:hypothetical protein